MYIKHEIVLDARYCCWVKPEQKIMIQLTEEKNRPGFFSIAIRTLNWNYLVCLFGLMNVNKLSRPG